MGEKKGGKKEGGKKWQDGGQKTRELVQKWAGERGEKEVQKLEWDNMKGRSEKEKQMKERGVYTCTITWNLLISFQYTSSSFLREYHILQKSCLKRTIN